MSLPKQLYYVKVLQPRPSRMFRGGGKYTQLDAALERITWLKARGVESELYVTQPLEWTKYEP
jgi:hypothetical protein